MCFSEIIFFLIHSYKCNTCTYHLSLILLLIGLDLHRPVVFEHSKRLLGNLIVLLACREDYTAACEARLTQYDMFVQSSSNVSLSGQEDATELERYGSVCSVVKREATLQTSLSQRVRDLIKFVSLRYVHNYMYSTV